MNSGKSVGLDVTTGFIEHTYAPSEGGVKHKARTTGTAGVQAPAMGPIADPATVAESMCCGWFRGNCIGLNKHRVCLHIRNCLGRGCRHYSWAHHRLQGRTGLFLTVTAYQILLSSAANQRFARSCPACLCPRKLSHPGALQRLPAFPLTDCGPQVRCLPGSHPHARHE